MIDVTQIILTINDEAFHSDFSSKLDCALDLPHVSCGRSSGSCIAGDQETSYQA